MRCLAPLMLCLSSTVLADTIEHYMNIADNIPRMEMKADPQSQAWARSARNVLIITAESIAESFIQINEEARNHGNPLFCLPASTPLNGVTMDNLIQETWRSLSATQNAQQSLTVSQVAWQGVVRKFPCNANVAHQIMQNAFGHKG